MPADARLAGLLGRYAAGREAGSRPSAAELCAEHPELRERLQTLIERYEEVDRLLTASDLAPEPAPEPPPRDLQIPGFRTVERLAVGGMGEIYKLEDLELGRAVAAKVIRRDSHAAERHADFLREARALALFQDPRIVQIHEVRQVGDDAVLIMELVDGFELGRIGPSLEPAQLARVMAEICEAVELAHAKGLQHRDLKPANLLLNARLQPKILDFGLSAGRPFEGRGAGTLAYAAPEQLDPRRPLDERTDIYALGVILYELLAGERPYTERDEQELAAAIVTGRPRLPVEIEPTVPEPLQAIALKAMEAAPDRRYASAREMARDLRRYLEGRAISARPSHYATALQSRVWPALAQLGEWLDLKLIYPHEAQGLRAAYQRLLARDDDWIVQSRRLTPPQISLYLGAFLLLLGGLFYFVAHRLFEGGEGLAGPVIALALPFVALAAGASLLEGQERRGLAVAWRFGATALLPVFLALLFFELGWGTPGEGQLLGDLAADRQLQAAGLLTTLWAFWLARRSGTTGLSVLFTAVAGLTAFVCLAEVGLRSWLDEERWDLVAAGLLPIVAFFAGLGRWVERRGRQTQATPLFVGAALLWALALELFCLDGRAFAFLGLSLDGLQPTAVADPTFLETMAAMTVAGLLIYGSGALLERSSSQAAGLPARTLLAVAPFAILHPLAHLNWEGGYAAGLIWLYLGLAVVVTFASQARQRKSFFFAGLLHTGIALFLLGNRYEWLDAPGWALAVISAGLLALGAGVLLDHRERRRHL